jgi:hypothetical protein
MNPATPAESVLDEVATWAGVSTQPTPRGATAILFEGQELGHVHANEGTLDLPLPGRPPQSAGSQDAHLGHFYG